MSAPKLAESVPAVTAPVKVPDAGPEMSRGWFIGNVITGGVLLALSVVLLIIAVVVS